MSFIDISGQRFGRLTVIERDYEVKPHTRQRTFWHCVCDCGKKFSAESRNLRRGDYQSCGCFQKDGARQRLTTHGMTNTKVFRIWQGMQARCYNPNNKKFPIYGGRGIKVCDRWLESFENFFADMGHPQPHESIDRMNNDGDYCPENCRWTDNKTQQRNTRRNHFLVLGGESKTIAEWSEITGIGQDAISERIKRGWSDRDALTKPTGNNGHHHYIEFNGESKTISAWSKVTNISRGAISTRLERGWTIEKALTTPPDQRRIRRSKRS